MRVFLLFSLLFIRAFSLFGQSVSDRAESPVSLSAVPTPPQPSERSWDTFIALFDELTDDDTDVSYQELLDDLYELYCHPINLNALDSLQLTTLPFLTSTQINDICTYVRFHQPLLSSGELTTIPSLDYRTRRLLQLFTFAGETPTPTHNLSTLLRTSRHELTLRTDIPLYTRMGYATYPAEQLRKNPNKVYQGSQPYFSSRYETNIGHTEAGLVLEKDPGERGIDYWSAYAVLHPQNRFDIIALGCYRAHFGLGLILNTGSSFGKTMTLQSLGSIDRGFRKHSSTSEVNYLRGLATTFQLSSTLRLSVFASYAPIDGTLRNDSSGISNLKRDGLHRTLLEISKKGNLRKTDGGINLQWQPHRLKLSASAVFTHFSLPLRPVSNTPSSRYRRYNAHGKDFANASFSYSYITRTWRLSGETATDRRGHVATLHMFQTNLKGHTLTLIPRYYPARFVSINGHTFSDNSTPQNECGVYLGWSHSLSHNSSLSAYADLIYFPWLKYQVSQSSRALDAQIQYTLTPRKNRVWNVRYRIKRKQKNQTLSTSSPVFIAFNTSQTLRTQYATSLSPHLNLQAHASLQLLHTPANGTQTGYALSSIVHWHRPSSRRSAGAYNLRIGFNYFHTDGYSTRITSYEPGLLYTLGMHTYQGHGIRSLLTFQLPLSSHITLLGKASTSYYFDRKRIGSGLNEIRQNHCEDLAFQLRLRI